MCDWVSGLLYLLGVLFIFVLDPRPRTLPFALCWPVVIGLTVVVIVIELVQRQVQWIKR